jgi:hypothetical protein
MLELRIRKIKKIIWKRRVEMTNSLRLRTTQPHSFFTPFFIFPL